MKAYSNPFGDAFKFKGTVKQLGGLHRNPAGARRLDLSAAGGKEEWPSLNLKFLTQAQYDALRADLFSGNPLYVVLPDRPATQYTCVFAEPGELAYEVEMLGDGTTLQYHVTINKLLVA